MVDTRIERRVWAGGHLDELEAMLLADGMPVPADAAQHAATCAACAAQVSLLRTEADALHRALALDEEEHAFLFQSRLPERVAALARTAPAWDEADVRWGTAPFGFALIALLAGYVGWLAAAPLLGSGLDLARRSGVTTLIVQRLLDALIWLVQSLWSAVALAAQTPLVGSPALSALGMAVVAWLAIWLLPRVSWAARWSSGTGRVSGM
jgi:hypothetical protein